MNEITIKEEKNVENMIYEIRGKHVMLDSDIAVEMSFKIVNAFISIKKYISINLIEQNYIN